MPHLLWCSFFQCLLPIQQRSTHSCPDRGQWLPVPHHRIQRSRRRSICRSKIPPVIQVIELFYSMTTLDSLPCYSVRYYLDFLLFIFPKVWSSSQGGDRLPALVSGFLPGRPSLCDWNGSDHLRLELLQTRDLQHLLHRERGGSQGNRRVHWRSPVSAKELLVSQKYVSKLNARAHVS